MPDQPSVPLPGGPSLAGMLPTILISAVCPFVTYWLLTTHVPALSTVTALAISAVFPLAHSLIGVVQRRSLDVIGIIVLVGIGVSIAATFVGGTPKLLLLRESFVTGALGLVALSSFAWRRPLMFYVAKQFSSGGNAAVAAQFDALWVERPGARRTFRVITAVWAVGWLVEFALRVAMVELLTVPQVLAIGPIVFNGINIGLMAWMIAYIRRVQARARRAGGS